MSEEGFWEFFVNFWTSIPEKVRKYRKTIWDFIVVICLIVASAMAFNMPMLLTMVMDLPYVIYILLYIPCGLGAITIFMYLMWTIWRKLP